MARKQRTNDEWAELVKGVDCAVNEGAPIRDACKKFGFYTSQYYKWKDKGATPLVKTVVYKPAKKASVARPVPRNESVGRDLLMFSGSPKKLAEFYKLINGGAQ